jgi:hypothetical protein
LMGIPKALARPKSAIFIWGYDSPLYLFTKRTLSLSKDTSMIWGRDEWWEDRWCAKRAYHGLFVWQLIVWPWSRHCDCFRVGNQKEWPE